MASDGIGRSHGQRVPPLTRQITSTLRNYPGGSQILKELIQNADDAHASEIEFLLDETQHSTDSLIHLDVAKYQGPALYAWNDALFQQEDWDGILDIGMSLKENDGLKVGRFGLGFLSVYHITDFPCILSNQDVLLLDPHNVIDPKGGRIISLNKFVTTPCIRSHVESFYDYFGYKGEHHYKGTIFRFPLRTDKSKISLPENIYNTNKIKTHMFEPFKQEVENCLLFMKSVHSVKVSVRNSLGISLLYSVNIDCSFRKNLSQHRKEMLKFVEDGLHVHSSRIFISIFPTCFIDCDQASTVRLWLVMNMLGLTAEARCSEMGRSYSERLGSYLPWFAVALPLPHSQHTLTSLQSQPCYCSEEFIDPTRFFHFIDNSIPQIPLSCELLDFVGNLFCFLPIAASSQFPFHIHGYFALSTNRRSIKWPRFDDLSDEASWNKELVQQLGTVSYAVLLHLAISRFRPLGKSLFHYRLWSCLPSGSETDELQSILHSGALFILRDSKIVFSKLDSSWIELSNGYYLPSFFRRTVPHEKTCGALLLQLSQPLVELTQEVSNVIMNYQFLEQQICERIICPDLIRKMLIRFQNLEILFDFLRHEQNVYALLEIVLFDLDFSSQQNVDKLNGIQLIPVCNSDLPMTFGGNGDETYYISEGSQDFLQLFPGLEQTFIKQSLPHHIHSSLLNLSRTGFVNLEDITDIRCDPEYFVEFLEYSMKVFFNLDSPLVWTPGLNNQPDKSWIEQVWRFIDQDQALLNALKESKMPLLPKQSLQAPRIDLLPLSTTHMPYLEHSTAAHQEIEKILASCGCHICHHHVFILPFSQFVLPPIPQGLLSILEIPTIKRFFVENITKANVKESLINTILSIDSLDDRDIALIKSFPIFLSMTNRLTTLDQNKSYCIPHDSIPIELDCYPNFINPCNQLNVKICWKLAIRSISLDETIKDHLLKTLSSDFLWDQPGKRIQLSLWILRNYSLVTPDVKCTLSTTKWLLDSNANPNFREKFKLFSLSNLFDPQDTIISQLMPVGVVNVTGGVFPNDQYLKHIDSLKALGLLTSLNLKYTNLDKIIKDALSNVENVRCENYPKWIIALIDLVHLHMNNLDLLNRHAFWNIFKISKFIFPSRNVCECYPKTLPFFQNSSYFKPSDSFVCSENESCLIAGVAPLIVDKSDPKENRKVIYRFMGFKKKIPIDLVCRQLEIITQHPINNHQGIYRTVREIYKYFQQEISSNSDIIREINLPQKFVYIPEFGFFGAERVVMSCDDQLLPYLFSLEKFYPAFEDNLTQFFKHFKIESEISFSKCQFILQQLQHSLLSPNEVNLALRVIQISSDLIQNESCTAQSLVLAEDGLVHPAVECVFNDLAWLKRSQLSTCKPIVHSRVSNTIASRIGCLPASLEMSPTAESIAYSFISDAGQSEDLVKRLRGILEGYRVHSDVFLELIQNSDDAGAKRVKILFDYTTHPCTSVLHKNMQAVHGPALYLFNDSVFTSRDFESILELSSGNKLNDTAKIGRFGVGFNAVYNFTDCPSFVSDCFVQIFDPLKKYIGPLSRDAGVRVCFTEDGSAVTTFHDQFQVYHDIFECDILNRVPYQFTLFRLPFRMNPSRLSDQTFNVETIAKLQTNILKEIPNIILFLQNVTSIEVYERKEDNFNILLTMTKSECPTTHFLQIGKPYFETYLFKIKEKSRPNFIVSVDEISLCKGSRSEKCIISYASGVGECFDVLQRFKSNITFLPLCGVTIPLEYIRTLPKRPGKIYAFLPLPIKSPLLLHINGYFSLSESRKNLSEVDVSSSGEATTSDIRTNWNLAIINDALSNALICALERLHKLEPLCSSRQVEHYANYYSLWPVKDYPHILWKDFPENFARRIVESFSSTDLFSCAHDYSVWVSFDEIAFLSLNDNLNINNDFIQFICTLCFRNGIKLANVPTYFKSTTIYKVFLDIKPQKEFGLRKICESIIFPNLIELSLENLVLIFNSLTPLCNDTVKNSENWLLNSLCDIAFIPCGSNESNFVLRKASDVVCPNTKIASLYQCEEMRIPVAELHEQFDLSKPDVIPNVLKRMGVIYDRLPVCEVISRCEVTTSFSIEDSTRHATTLIEYLSQEDRDFFGFIFPKIKSIPFIPTHQDALFDTLSISDNFIPFASPNNCYTYSCRFLVTPHCPCVSSEVVYLSKRFSIPETPSLEIVLGVLEYLIHSADLIRKKSFKIDRRIQAIYAFIAEIAHINEDNMSVVKEKLKDTPWIWHPDFEHFYPSNQVILSSDFKTLDDNKYLIGFPFMDSVRDIKFKRFLICVGVKEEIDDENIIVCIHKIYEEFKDGPLPHNLAQLVIKLTMFIVDYEGCSDKVFLLSQMNTLHPPSQLYLNLSVRFEEGDLGLFVHSDITALQALKLGAKTSEELFFTSTDFDESDFGVEEEITDRIQSLVRDIPMDALVKELIQNAEDSEVTEIVFILDDQDYSDRIQTLSLPGKVFPNWKHLHSFPSLCVYNNKGFTEEDFKGIQMMSVGGKIQARKSIGKFGLGFNSVYQITDAPTFITTQDGNEELTFCCFDPFIKYTAKSFETKSFKKKRGKRINVKSEDYPRFSDQFFPFKFEKFSDHSGIDLSLVNLWKNTEFTMFRFPLDICCNSLNPKIKPNILYSKVESRKHCSLEALKNVIFKQLTNCSEMLLFLTHVQSLKLFSIDNNQNLVLEYSQNFKGFESKLRPIQHYCPRININININVQRKCCTNFPSVSRRSEFEYLVYSFPDLDIEQYVDNTPELETFRGKYREEKLWGFGSVAVCTSDHNPVSKFSLFTFLPFSEDQFPVLVNAPLIFDATRQHFNKQLSQWAEAWHSSIIKCILVPLYTMLLVDLRVPLQQLESVEAKREYFEWFYSLFPGKSHNQFLTELSNELYSFLYETNPSILLCDNLDMSVELLQWYSLHGPGCGVFKPISVFPISVHEVATPDLDVNAQNDPRWKEKELFESLILIQFPLSLAPTRLLNCFKAFKLLRLNQPLLLTHITESNHSLFHENSSSCSLENSVLDFKQFQTILEYILTAGDEFFTNHPNIPLCIDISDNVHCFRKDKPYFRHTFSSLLPHCSESFISSKFDSRIVSKMSALGYVTELNCDFLSDHLDVERFDDMKQYSLFWEFVIQEKLDGEDLNRFHRHELVPICSEEKLFSPIKNLKYMLSPTLNNVTKDPILFKALNALKCPLLSFDFFDQHSRYQSKVKHYLDKIAISQIRPGEIILGSLNHSTNRSACLEQDEVDKLYQIFSQMNTNQFNSYTKPRIICELKLFQTISGEYLSLSGCKLCFMNTETLVLGPATLQMLEYLYELVIFQHYPGNFLKVLCSRLQIELLDVYGLLSRFIFRNLPNLPYEEQKHILRFFSQNIALGNMHLEFIDLITVLGEIPFICIENEYFTVKDLYSPEREFFCKFLAHYTLPDVWSDNNLRLLFNQLGLRECVTLEDILRVAVKFSNTEIAFQNLPYLLNTLAGILNEIVPTFNQNTIEALRQIGQVEFLPARIMTNIIETCQAQKLVRFCDAQLNQFQDCCCTTAWIHEYPFNFPKVFHEYLGIIERPDASLVKEHLINITNQINRSNRVAISDDIYRYFPASYEYLELYPDGSNNFLNELCDLPCILMRNKLYYPINMLFTSSEDLSPFVLQLPNALAGRYPNFLESIGVEKIASYKHFALVLLEISAQLETVDIELENMDFLKQAETVFNRLITALRELDCSNTPLDLALSQIMLLTIHSKLFPCSEVIFGDNPSLLSRVNTLQLQFNILKPLEPDQNKSCVPPTCLQLRKLTEFIEEKIDRYEVINPLTCLASSLRDKLRNSTVFCAMRRLYFHLTKKDLKKLFLKNGETYFDDGQTHPGFQSVSQLLKNLQVISVEQIDLLITDIRQSPPTVHRLPNSCGCYVDANNQFLISDHHLKADCIYKDISYAINAYLGNIFTEALSSFELCFMLNPTKIMDKLNEYNITIDSWSLSHLQTSDHTHINPAPFVPPLATPSIPINLPLPNTLSNTALQPLIHACYPGLVYGPRSRPENIPNGEPDIPAARLWLMVSQCDIFVAERLTTISPENDHLFPAHACFCSFEAVVKAFVALLHYRGSEKRLEFERNLRFYLDHLPFLIPDNQIIRDKIEQLIIPLMNYDLETRIPSSTCTPGMGCYIPQQIFTIDQAMEARTNAHLFVELLMAEFPEMGNMILDKNNPLLKCQPLPPLITAILTSDVGSEFSQVNLSTDHNEFRAVSRCFYTSMPYSEIVFINKICNPTSWNAFKQNISQETNRHPQSCLYIRSLFHGSSSTHPDCIINDREGFNMKFAQGGLWGRGIYFATNCSYSHDRYRYTAGDLCCVFLATVFVGYSKEFQHEDRNLTQPPLMPNSMDRYHSVQGRKYGEVIHVVYKNCMAYPSYLITYRP